MDDQLPLHEIERRTIITRLAKCDGNRSSTAKSLGISRRALQLKLARFGIAREWGRPTVDGRRNRRKARRREVDSPQAL